MDTKKAPKPKPKKPKKPKKRFSRIKSTVSLRTRRLIDYKGKLRNVVVELTPTNSGLGFELKVRLKGSSRRVPVELDSGQLYELETRLVARKVKARAQLELGIDLGNTLFEADETQQR